MADALADWRSWASPLLGGRFDFSRGASEPSFNALGRALVLTRGRFWARIRGGHDLRRMIGRMPNTADLLAGRADGRAEQITTFPWVRHEASTRYQYAAFAVGAGGVVEPLDAPALAAEFDAAGALRPPLPNVPRGLRAVAAVGGRFLLEWFHDERGQEAAPGEFRIFNDANAPGSMNYGAVVATIRYRPRAAGFSWLSDPFEHGVRVQWAVRAATEEGEEESGAIVVSAVADAAPPSAEPDLRFGPRIRM